MGKWQATDTFINYIHVKFVDIEVIELRRIPALQVLVGLSPKSEARRSPQTPNPRFCVLPGSLGPAGESSPSRRLAAQSCRSFASHSLIEICD